MFSSLNDLIAASTTTTETLSVGAFSLCIIAALVLGIVFSSSVQFKNIVSKSFAVTIAILPAVVCMVIMMVSGSIGAGIAVAGTFSLVRFRSAPGTAKEIAAVFIAMAIGLACGMGNIGYALVFTVITIIATFILENTKFGEFKDMNTKKMIKITIPEDLDYTEVFDDLFKEYTSSYQLMGVKTTNLGSLFKLTYHLTLKNPGKEKEFIDKLRVRNGNLEISSSIMSNMNNEL
ncbi:MAG: DUF4956 domain-containing protein [Sedimentibacter sp.]